jgi:hypothetical protein
VRQLGEARVDDLVACRDQSILAGLMRTIGRRPRESQHGRVTVESGRSGDQCAHRESESASAAIAKAARGVFGS